MVSKRKGAGSFCLPLNHPLAGHIGPTRLSSTVRIYSSCRLEGGHHRGPWASSAETRKVNGCWCGGPSWLYHPSTLSPVIWEFTHALSHQFLWEPGRVGWSPPLQRGSCPRHIYLGTLLFGHRGKYHAQSQHPGSPSRLSQRHSLPACPGW